MIRSAASWATAGTSYGHTCNFAVDRGKTSSAGSDSTQMTFETRTHRAEEIFVPFTVGELVAAASKDMIKSE